MDILKSGSSLGTRYFTQWSLWRRKEKKRKATTSNNDQQRNDNHNPSHFLLFAARVGRQRKRNSWSTTSDGSIRTLFVKLAWPFLRVRTMLMFMQPCTQKPSWRAAIVKSTRGLALTSSLPGMWRADVFLFLHNDLLRLQSDWPHFSVGFPLHH